MKTKEKRLPEQARDDSTSFLIMHSSRFFRECRVCHFECSEKSLVCGFVDAHISIN